MKIPQLPYPLLHSDRVFLRVFPRHLASLSRSDKSRMWKLFQGLVKDNLAFIEDRQSQSHLICCALVLSAYRQMHPLAKSQCIQELAHALRQPGGRILRIVMRLSLLLSRAPRTMIETQTKRRIAQVYGKAFTVTFEHSPEMFVSVVSRCGYHRFFVQNAAPELTQVFCAWDALWSDEIDRSGIARFSRPGTIADGHGCCRFEVRFAGAGKDGEAGEDGEKEG